MRVVIVGAGIIGCAIARELGARGVACAIVDDRVPGGGASHASAGMLAPYVEAHDAGPLRTLGVRSLDLYDAWIARVREESGVDVEYRRIGTLEVALDPAHAADLRRLAEQNASIGAEWSTARRAALGTIAGALYTPIHGYVAVPELTDALAEAAKRSGAALHRARVTTIARADGGFAIATTAGVLHAPQVVVAAGAWSGLLHIAGVSPPPTRPVRGQLLHLGWSGTPIETIVWGPACYVVPRIDGSILVGATAEEVGFDERATSGGVRGLLDAVSQLLPESPGASFLGARVGLRPATPDDLPVIAPDPRVPGLTYATGHYRNGVLLAPLTAQVVAGWIVGGVRDACFDALSVERFRRS